MKSTVEIFCSLVRQTDNGNEPFGRIRKTIRPLNFFLLTIHILCLIPITSFASTSTLQANDRFLSYADELPASEINFYISGCVIGQGIESKVIIFDKTKNFERFYRIGDMIQDYKIINITREKVFFEHDGKAWVVNFIRQGSNHKAIDAPMAMNGQNSTESEIFHGIIKPYETKAFIEQADTKKDSEQGGMKRPKGITFKSKQKIDN